MSRLFVFVLLIVSILSFALAQTPTYAQQSTCPTAILVDIARAGSTCFGLEPGQACVGNGSVTSSGEEDAASFSQTGDRASLSDLRRVQLESDEDELGIAYLSLPSWNPPWGALTVIAFGDVFLSNNVLSFTELNAIATGTVNIRAQPQADAEIIGRANVNDGFVVQGRNRSGEWLRVWIPGTSRSGWASADVLNVQGNVLSLDVVGASDFILDPFRTFGFFSGEAHLCGGHLPNGMLLQSGNNEQVAAVQFDTYWIELRGTAFVGNAESGDTPFVYMLDGYAVVYSVPEDSYVPAGAVAGAYGYIRSFDPTSLSLLPLQLLPIPVSLPDAITHADIVRLTAEYEAEQAAAEATPTPQPTADPTVCQRVTRRETTLYAGPGDFYEAINSLPAGSRVTPVVETNDPDGRMWWQLGTSNWLLASDVRESGVCSSVPVTQTITAPSSNTLSLETCETTNGPLRAGQQVRIEFTPPAFDNRGEGRDAPIIDPGRISIGAQMYRAQVTDMVQIGTVGIDDRYLRTFYITWTAVPGTHRIVGDRLSYEPICTLVVPIS